MRRGLTETVRDGLTTTAPVARGVITRTSPDIRVAFDNVEWPDAMLGWRGPFLPAVGALALVAFDQDRRAWLLATDPPAPTDDADA